ncbi:MAG: prepilin-type N-terminal cleavage/methylation domain-containing protein [Pseudomonadales bacterium]|nr:prepilin-type N-terminal cleavage/methylation domain-containing protein [Pseudomonadales bacterium]
MRAQKQRTTPVSGFTVVEMITVLLLLGVLSAVAISRMVGTSAYEAALLRDFVASQTAHARRHATFRQDVNILLTLTRTAAGLTAVVSGGAEILHRDEWQSDARIDVAGTELITGESLLVGYGGSGYLRTVVLRGAALPHASGIAIAAIGEQLLDLCLHPSGVSRGGQCV